jgi:endonuclease/exonuclease/phosphatase family metal-dependent hydrolase
MKRISQALEVRRLVDRILTGDPEAAIVVAGDFNAEPDDVPVLAIRGRIQDTRETVSSPPGCWSRSSTPSRSPGIRCSTRAAR